MRPRRWHPGPVRWSRRGGSLAEVLVAVSILGLAGAASTRLLVQAVRELEGAELGLRAVLLFSEAVQDPTGDGPGEGSGVNAGSGRAGGWTRPAGPGVLRLEWESARPVVRYDPPLGLLGHGSEGARIGRGFGVSRAWTLQGEP